MGAEDAVRDLGVRGVERAIAGTARADACADDEPAVSTMVRFTDATFRYAGADEPALSALSFEAARGEIVALTGAPGSGTSTLLLVAGGYAPRLIGGTLTGGVERSARAPAIVFATPWTQL